MECELMNVEMAQAKTNWENVQISSQKNTKSDNT